MARLFWLSDEAWARTESLLPHGEPGKPQVDDRRVISGILHVLPLARCAGGLWTCTIASKAPLRLPKAFKAAGQASQARRVICPSGYSSSRRQQLLEQAPLSGSERLSALKIINADLNHL